MGLNKTILLGRITQDLELKQTPSGVSVLSFTVAVDRSYTKGEEKQSDFISCVAWKQTAEFISRYFGKGRMIAVEGNIKTGSYQNKNGETVYTTDVVADRVEFLEWGDKPQGQSMAARVDEAPAGFSAIDEDIPF